MGVEKEQVLGHIAVANDRPVGRFARPASNQTGNQLWMGLSLAWIVGDTAIRQRVLAAVNEQLVRGLGRCEGKIEGFCLDHHGNYWLLPVVTGLKHALAIKDDEAIEAFLRLLAAWLGFFDDHDAPNGQVACAGWRAWPYRPEGGVEAYLARITEPDGWHHGSPGAGLNTAADTINRVWRGLPQLDNRFRERDDAWMRKQRADEPLWQAAILLSRLANERDLRRKLPTVEWVYPIGLKRAELENGFEVRMVAEPRTVASKAWGAAPAVRLEYDPRGGHKHLVSWYPRTLPERSVA